MAPKGNTPAAPSAFDVALRTAAERKPEAAADTQDAVTNHPDMVFGDVAAAQKMIGDRKGLIVFCPAPEGDTLPKSKTGKSAILGAARNGWGDPVQIGPLETTVAFRWSMKASG